MNNNNNTYEKNGYAYSAVCAAAALLQLDYKEAFKKLIEGAHKFCVLPAEEKPIRWMLKSLGFFMQPCSPFEGMGTDELCRYLTENMPPETVGIAKINVYTCSAAAAPIISENGVFHIVSDCKYVENMKVQHIWLRWPDGEDHSPKKRRSGIVPPVRYTKTISEEKSDVYVFYNPNPSGKRVGDCIIRGIAGALDISWDEALDLLAAYGDPIVNLGGESCYYARVLEERGFKKRPPVVSEKHKLTGAEFCKMCTESYHSGERIFARVGRSHAAAILPCVSQDGTSCYKIYDSWNSSSEYAGEFWIRKPPVNTGEDNRRSFGIGDKIIHPKYGVGLIIGESTSSPPF